jgi:DNA-binding CsgD family transcriptional regulator
MSSRFYCGRENGVVGSLATGESLKAIGRAFGKPSSSIYFQVAPHGGIRPAARRRSTLALTLSEREKISRGITAHQSTRSLARLLGRSPSTVSREISRNGGYDRYRAALADEKAWVRTRRPKRCKLANLGRISSPLFYFTTRRPVTLLKSINGARYVLGTSTATTEVRTTFKRFEATLIEVPCLFCGGASKSRAVPRRLDDTVHLTLPERHRAISRLPRLDWRSRRGFSFHNAPPCT